MRWNIYVAFSLRVHSQLPVIFFVTAVDIVRVEVCRQLLLSALLCRLLFSPNGFRRSSYWSRLHIAYWHPGLGCGRTGGLMLQLIITAWLV